MKKLSLFIVQLAIAFISVAQVSKDYAVMVTAEVSDSPPSIIVKWNNSADATAFSVYRKTESSNSWGAAIANLSGTEVEYIDNAVVVDSGYEYRVYRSASSGINSYGYAYSAIKLGTTDYRGKCLLVVDTTITSSIEIELNRLMKDISGDGWQVKRINVNRNDSVKTIKNLIVTEYNADADTKCVLLFGHVPVPYSGNLNPDGHPDHLGAWPCDGFYGDMNGTWTDATVNNITASRQENWNVPGDGKYDQSSWGTIELQIGRVDLYNLPSFPDSENVLLKRYLDKDHAFRTGEFTNLPQGLIDDNFGAFSGEAFASSGFRSFAPMFGDTAVKELDYFGTMQTNSYLWSYGCGGGWYQGASGVGSTTDFVNDSVQSVFTMLFGSYFGDWDSQDNFLRAPLASKGQTLTSCWSGRPHWFFHHMALGENIGYSTLRVMNNSSTYFASYYPKYTHIALMGDPTLRMHVVRPPSSIVLTPPNGYPNTTSISWTASPDNVLGYYVYTSNTEFGKYDRISDTIISGTSFIDENLFTGVNWYMVKAVRLEETPSGSYYNTSTSIGDSVYVVVSGNENILGNENQFSVFPNPASYKITIQSSTSNLNSILVITNDVGRIILEKKITSNKTSIDISEFAAGIYFVKLNGVVKKVVVE
ncbi:MAG: T9SS type A sorting domain-containing protein [Chitinophagales bacterium]|nr:T9SS type A sorting domain-containing protein [Chitinophagales bacterium]